MKRLVLVDGYNLIRNDPMLAAIEARSLEAGRRALVSRMLTSFDHLSNDITVVFDGANAPSPAPASERLGQVRVVYSRQGETADTVILRMIAAEPAGRPLLVLSDDNELRTAAQRHGGIVGGAADRARPRPATVRTPATDSDDRPRSTDKKGNPRRAKRRSRSAPLIRW
jgi:predicted RNA-binding protein with PIN domain